MSLFLDGSGRPFPFYRRGLHRARSAALFALELFLTVAAISAERHRSQARNLDVAAATHATPECALPNSVQSPFNVPLSLTLASALVKRQLPREIGSRALPQITAGSLSQRSTLLLSAPERLERFGAQALQQFLKGFKIFGVHGSSSGHF
jgi:hypothetical protein